ncbi:hypothetical protein Tco_0667327 [Tanacetum coccineum]
MKVIQDQVRNNTIPFKMDQEILDKFLQRTNRGHRAGRGNSPTFAPGTNQIPRDDADCDGESQSDDK